MTTSVNITKFLQATFCAAFMCLHTKIGVVILIRKKICAESARKMLVQLTARRRTGHITTGKLRPEPEEPVQPDGQ